MRPLGSILIALVAALPTVSRVHGEDRPTPDLEKVFARRDGDKDGSLTIEEFKKGLKDKALETADRRFKRMDTDGNGKISLEEFKAGVKPKPA